MKYNINENETCVSCAAPKMSEVPMPQLADVAKKTEAVAGETQELCWQIEVFLFGDHGQNPKQRECLCMRDSMMNTLDTLCATHKTLLRIACALGVQL